MLRKLGVAGLVAGAAFGAVLAGSRLRLRWSLVRAGVRGRCGPGVRGLLASGVLAVNIPILSPQSNGNCESSAVGGNYSE